MPAPSKGSMKIILIVNNLLISQQHNSIIFLLVERKGTRPVKTEWWGTGMVICLEQGAIDLQMVQLIPLSPHHLLLH